MLRLESARLQELSHWVTGYGIYRIDATGLIRSWNPGAERITGLPALEVIGRHYGSLFTGEARRARQPEKALQRARELQHLREDHGRRRGQNEAFEARVTLDVARLEDGALAGFVEVFCDVTEERNRERALYAQATRDPLTGVFNRGHFTEHARQEIERARRFHEPLSLALMDIDHFKSINDRFGHEAGDAALVQVARTVRGMIRRVDAFGRVGGEEFGILLPRASAEAAADLLQRIRLALAQTPVDSPPHHFQLTASFGVAQLSSATEDLAALMRNADAALYRAKREGRNQIQVWRGP